MKLKHANMGDSKDVYETITHYKDIFPHVRYDAICRRIKNGTCVWDHSVAITYTEYKRKVEVGLDEDRRLPLFATKGDVMIHQIAAKRAGNGDAYVVMKKFIHDLHKGKRVWLTVRQDNHRATKFYEKLNMNRVGVVYWMNGKLAGYVYCYDGTSKLL